MQKIKVCRFIFCLCITFISYGKSFNALACGDDEETGFTYPLEDWSESCDFDVTCAASHHMGIDGVPSSGDVVGSEVVAPCTGVIQEAQYHNGYGGMVIMECWTGSECVTPFVAHLYSSSLQVYSGERVEIGQTIGYIADKGNNGGYSPHVHFGVRKGEYISANYSGCVNDRGTAVWYFAGYPGSDSNPDNCYDEIVVDMYHPDEFISEHSEPVSTCTDVNYDVILTEAKAETSSYVVYDWYQTSADTTLTLYGSVADLSAYTLSETRQWLKGEVSQDDYEDLVTSISEAGTRHVYVFKATGDGGFYGPEEWYSDSESAIDKILIGDADGDGVDDLIVGNANSSDEYSWKICLSNGVSFDDCSDWKVDGEVGATFASTDSVILAADLNGNGKIELIRGKSGSDDCPNQLKWRRLTQEGNVDTIEECWGYPEEETVVDGDGTYKAQYMVGNIDADDSEEIINIRFHTSSSGSESVNAFKADFNTTTDILETDEWTNSSSDGDIAGYDGWYYMADINQDGYDDLVRWGDGGSIKWMKNESGILKKSKYDLIDDLERDKEHFLFFGYFGIKTICVEDVSHSTTSTGGGSSSSVDTDHDGLTDSDEIAWGTDDDDIDSDDDGLGDGEEVNFFSTDPTDSDSDNDGLSDSAEVEGGSDPNAYTDWFSPILAILMEGDDDGDGYDAEDDGGDDCDDDDSSVYPGATETCGDGIDQDCDGADTECVITYTVTKTADTNDGKCTESDCSLREAMAVAKADTSGYEIDIVFDISSTDSGCNITTGLCTISPTKALPALNRGNTVIDGEGLIVIDGTSAGSTTKGFTINNSSSNVIANIGIQNFGSHGIYITGASSSENEVSGCYIGTDSSGSDQSNGGSGIYIASGSATISKNVIAYNLLKGIHLTSALTLGVVITQNSLHDNVSTGIVLASGANNSKAKPVISTATASGSIVTIIGTATAGDTIEIFNASTDSEGQTYIGETTTDSSGTWTYTTNTTTAPKWSKIITTATDTTNGTSQFSATKTVK